MDSKGAWNIGIDGTGAGGVGLVEVEGEEVEVFGYVLAVAVESPGGAAAIAGDTYGHCEWGEVQVRVFDVAELRVG